MFNAFKKDSSVQPSYIEMMRHFGKKYSDVVPKADIVDIIDSKSSYGCSADDHHFFKGLVVGFFSSLSANNKEAGGLCSDIVATIDTLIAIIKVAQEEPDAQKQ